MHLYLNYARAHWGHPDENPPIGLILCTERGESLARYALEGLPNNVHTTAVCPGFTYSEFHDVNGMRAQVSTLPSWMWMDAATVARQAFDAVMAGRIIYVNGRVNRAMVLLARYLPQWLVLAVVKRVSGSYRKL